MMRIISVVGLNSGQDEDEQDQQLEGANSGKAQASVKTYVFVSATCAQVGRCSRGISKSRGNGRGAKRNQAQAGSQMQWEIINPSRWSGHF